MESNKDLFSKLGRIFVALFAVTVFAGTITGCGKSKEKEAQSHVDKGNDALNSGKAIKARLVDQGVWQDHGYEVIEKVQSSETTMEDLRSWQRDLRNFRYYFGQAKAEGEQAGVDSPTAYINANMDWAQTLLEIVEAEIKSRGEKI